MARPTKYSKAVAEYICDEIADGSTLTAICDAARRKAERPLRAGDEFARALPDEIPKGDAFPTIRCVLRWLTKNSEFRHEYACAHEAYQQRGEDEIIDIPDRCVPDPGFVAKARLQVVARQWALGRRRPKKHDLPTIRAEIERERSKHDAERRVVYELADEEPTGAEEV